ncbi:formate transporter FocA [Shewanella vesiculosa]|uniref:formate transporter FocA n=1 Tax=Shewanella vesiculosa TaxID=518738 RepID=UPI000F4F9030|nr:formate transporter FocA [Shewanella vesiculosa]RPA50813.1 formate transporter FocA [Shewanella vesiculosa]UJL44201.1 formate transporter FocA [Shewanella vesiculosa]
MREEHAPEANPYLLTAKQKNHFCVVDEHIVISPFEKAAEYGHAKVTKHFGQSFGLSVFAGAFIALAFVFYLTVTTGSSADSWGLVRFSGGIAFSLGLILVVVLGGELFTSTVLSAIAWAQKRVSTKQLLGCWTRVYLGNLCGAMLILLLVMMSKMYAMDSNQWGLNALHVSQHKIHHDWSQAFALGILCNLLVCLGVWMTFSCKDALAKSLLLILPVAMFVSSGFEHSIANLFMVPLGIAIQHFAGNEYFSALGVMRQTFADLTLSNFLFNNLIPVTLGNIVGGAVFVGLGYYWIDNTAMKVPGEAASQHISTITKTPMQVSKKYQDSSIAQQTQYQPSQEDLAMKNKIQKLIVSELMDTKPTTLSVDTSIYQALTLLAKNNVRSAPVIDKDNQLLGFVSEQDLMRSLWSEEFASTLPISVKDIMQTKMLTVAPTEKIVQLLEFMVVDKNKLFPVTDSGMFISGGYQSYEERLRDASATVPSTYPVVENGRLCGVIRRETFMQMFAKLYSPEHDGITHPVEQQSVA